MSRRQDYIWNSAAGGMGAAELVVMTMVTSRNGVILDVGVLTFAFAVGNLLMTVGKFGARVYHATDVARLFCYKTYLRCRIATIALMVIALFAYLSFQYSQHEWSNDKTLAVIWVSAIYAIETVEDCICGELQRNSFLYVGGQMFVARWGAIFVAFSITLSIVPSLAMALLVGFVASLVVFVTWVLIIKRRLSGLSDIGVAARQQRDAPTSNDNVPSLLKHLSPLFLASFLVMYLYNAPKFAIDNIMTDEAQAYFGLVSTPSFLIMLFHQFVYQPSLPTIAAEWTSGNVRAFRRRVRRQTLALLAISAVCIALAAILGIPFLSCLYHVDLSGYWRELVILQVVGIFLALSGYLTVLLTIMREGKRLLLGYASTTALALLIVGPLTRASGTIGASCGYLLAMLCLSLFFGVMYSLKIKESI